MKPNSQPRPEQVVFDELTALCAQPGYLHAVSWFCFRDNLIKVGDELKVRDLRNLYGYDRLIRPEITTLIGLALKGPLDLRAHTGRDRRRSLILIVDSHAI